MDLIENAGIFIYPLAICSLIAVFVSIERFLALRPQRVTPEDYLKAPPGSLPSDDASCLGRISRYGASTSVDADAIEAYARLEVSRLERGLFLLEVVIGVAPLLGLLGTVMGLTQVFSGFSASTGLPDPSTFIKGIALALNTTIIGLAVAIPALGAHAYFMRRVESIAAQIGVWVQQFIAVREVKSA